jgi:hypothetical protein
MQIAGIVYMRDVQAASHLQLVGGVKLASASEAGINTTFRANFLGRCEIYRLRHKSNYLNHESPTQKAVTKDGSSRWPLMRQPLSLDDLRTRYLLL